MKLTNIALATLLGAALLGGCTPEARDKYDAAGDSAASAVNKTGDAVATDAAKTGDAVAEGAKKTGDAVEEGAKKTGEAINNAAAGTAEAVKNTAKNAAAAVDNTGITAKVKNALLTAENLPTNNLNVDTIDKKVVLRGSVDTAANKKRAEEIAKTQVGAEYTVENQLTVGQK